MYAVADLDDGIKWAGDTFDATPVYGGAHVGLGTHNALLSLGETYLEIIAPDPAQELLPGTLGAQLADLSAGGLVTWAVQANLDDVAASLSNLGMSFAGPRRTERKTADGDLLVWALLFPAKHAFGARMPFFIDWMECTHPSTTSPVGGRFIGLKITVPEADDFKNVFAELGLVIEVAPGEPSMVVTIECAQGTVDLATSAETLDLKMG